MAQEKSIFLQHTDSLVFMRRGKKKQRELVSGQRTNQQKFLKAFQASYGPEREEAEKSFPFSFAARTERKIDKLSHHRIT